MSDYPAHNRKCLFKYTSADTAVKIIESSSVIYRSPVEFNDPFDIQAGLHYDFDPDLFPDRILDRIEALVSQTEKPKVLEAEPFGQLICTMWEKKATHGFPKARMRELFRPKLASLMQDLLANQVQYQDRWWRDFLPRLRVFCVSEENDNLLMWSHYAKDHTGVVIKFRVLPKEDNPLCIARPIQYRKTPPPLFTERELIDSTLAVQALDPSTLLQYACMKSDIWSYEKEWRVWDLLPQAEPQLYSRYPVARDEIGAIYLGCKIDPEIKSKILKLLTSHPNAKAYQASKAIKDYALRFHPI